MRHRDSFFRFALATALLLLCAASAFSADTPLTKITIAVKNHLGRPVDGATVVVTFVQGRSIIKFGKQIHTTYNLRTNQEGEAKIPSIPQGNIRVLVSAKGYQTFGEVFPIAEAEKTVDVTLNPPQPQYSAH